MMRPPTNIINGQWYILGSYHRNIHKEKKETRKRTKRRKTRGKKGKQEEKRKKKETKENKKKKIQKRYNIIEGRIVIYLKDKKASKI